MPTQNTVVAEFDPDAYLQSKTLTFDPDSYLGIKPDRPTGSTFAEKIRSVGNQLVKGQVVQDEIEQMRNEARASPEVKEAAMRYGVPIAAMLAAPATGGVSLLLGAAGGFTGEIMAQASEVDRGRDDFGYGRLVIAPIVAGTPLGPATKMIQAFTPAGKLLASVPQAIIKRGAYGGGIGAGASAIEQAIDKGEIDLGELAKSAAWGTVFGTAIGGIETYRATKAFQEALLNLRKVTGDFKTPDLEFIEFLRRKARGVETPNRAGTRPNMPAEEGGVVSPEQIQALPEGYTEVVPSRAATVEPPIQPTPPNAVQVTSAAPIPVRNQPGGGAGVRVENAVAQETTGARLIEEAAQGAKSVPAVAAPTAAGTPAAPGTHVMPDGSVMADAEMAAPAAAAPVQQAVAPVAAPDMEARRAKIDAMKAAAPVAPTEKPPAKAASEGQPSSSEVRPDTVPVQAPETVPQKKPSSNREIADQRRKIRNMERVAEKLDAIDPKRAAALRGKINSEQSALADMLDRKESGPRPTVGPAPDGEPDILTDIAEHVGTLRTAGDSDSKGRLNLLQGVARRLRGGESGREWGDAVHSLNMIGTVETTEQGKYSFRSIAELEDAISKAIAQREKVRASLKAQDYYQKVETTFIPETEKANELVAQGKALPIEEIGVGGAFKINDEKFSVVGVEETADGNYEYIVKDGHMFRVPEGTLVAPDKGKVTHAKPLSKQKDVEFLPEEKPTAPEIKLESVTEKQQATEAAAARAKATAEAKKKAVVAEAEKPLTGDSSNVAQGQLLAEHEDLFSGESQETVAKREEAEAPGFSPDDILIMHSPFTNTDSEVNFRGPMPGGKAMVVPKSGIQMAVPMEWLRAKPAEADKQSEMFSIGRVGSPPAPPAPVGPNPADYPPNPSPVDDPVFTQLPIQLPEMLEFYKAITGGKIPRIVESISRRGGEASGVFRYKEGTPDSGTIELRADLFRLLSQAEKNKLMGEAVAWATLMKEANPSMNLHEAIKSKFNELVKAAELEALKRDPVHAMHVFAHEIWHQVDFLPDATLKRGNILGHLATFKRYLWGYLDSHPGLMRDPDAKPFPTTPELNALRQQAKKELDDAVKEIVETIKREVPIYNELPVTADHITSILKNAQRDEFPDLYDWFQVQDRATKVAVLRAAMKGLVDERAARFASRKQVGTQTVEETITRRSGPEPTPEKIRERFEELLREELRQRGLVSERDIRRELQSAIAWWQGVQVMPPYFSSAVEMFAEAGSMFLNNPAALEKRAPIFYQTLVNYIQRKPEIEKAYLKVQDDIRAGVLMPKRVQGLFESWRTDSAAGLARDLEFNKLDWKALKATFNLAFNKHQWPAQVLAQKLIGDPKADKLLGSLQDYLYRQTAVEGLARQVNMRVEKPLHDNNLKHEDISELMFHNRIVHGDAQQTANSRGWSPNTSTQRLAEMQANLGPQRWNVLRGALEALRSIYEEGPIKLLEVSGALDPKLMAFIKENIHYSPFQKAREAFNPLTESTIEGMIDAAYGEGIGAKIFHRRGYLGDIQSPYVAMLKKAESLTKFAYKQIAINAFVDFKLAHDPDGIKEADKKFNGKIMAPVEIDSQKIGTIFRMRGGVVDGFYVPRAEYEAFENASGIEQMLIGVATYPLSFFRSVLTELNAGIWPVLLVRDLGALAIQMPGGMRQLLKPGTIPRNYQTAKASFTSKPNPAADTLLKRLMVISKADPRGDWVGIKDETDRWLLRMSKYPEVWDQEMRKISRFINWWEWYKTQGQIFERTSKAIGQEVVDSDMWRWPTTPEWMKQKFVTELSGSPNFLARGRDISVLETFTGNIFVNAMMRGYEAMHTAAKLDPKGFWTKFMLSIGFSSMAVFSFIQGWTDFGMDPEEAEDQREKYRSIPEFSKLQGWVIPLFWVNKEQKQVLYLTVPFPDSMRILHAGLRKLMQTAVSQDAGNMGLSSLTQYGGTQLPGTNPLFTAGSEWWQYAVQGRNPYDPFRGKQVLDDTVFTAGKGAADLASRTAANLTGGMFFRYQQTIPGKTKSDIEKLLTWGPVANIFGRWLKISNAGIHEENQAALEPNKTERAELQLVAQELMRKNSEGEDWTENERLLVSVKPYIIEYMRNRFKDVAAQSQGPEMLDFRRGNREQRRILVETWGKREQVKEARRLRGEPELERVPDDSIPKSPPPPAPPPNEKPLSQYQEGAIYRDKVTGVSRRYRQGQFV